MRVRFQVSGGLAAFPGLMGPRTIDVDALDPEARRSLTGLIDAAHFFELPARLAAPKGADYQSYDITVEDDERRHTVHVSDPVTHPGLQALIARLRQLTTPAR
jgi:emfourin